MAFCRRKWRLAFGEALALAGCDRLLQDPGATFRLRETGRYIHAEVCGIDPDVRQNLQALWPGGPERSWRLAQLSFVPPDEDAA